MQFYWKCEECDETNPYPNVKICETCGAPMSAVAEQAVLREQREEALRLERLQQELQRKRREEERARLEAERKKREARIAAQRAEAERLRLAARKERLRKQEEAAKKFGSFYLKSAKFLVGLLRSTAVLVIIVSVLLGIKYTERITFKPAFERIFNNIRSEYLIHTVAQPIDQAPDPLREEAAPDGAASSLPEGEDPAPDEGAAAKVKRKARGLHKLDEQLCIVAEGIIEKVSNRFRELKDTYTPVSNTVDLIKYFYRKVSNNEYARYFTHSF